MSMLTLEERKAICQKANMHMKAVTDEGRCLYCYCLPEEMS